MQITVPTRGGNSSTISGAAYGPFLIHRPISGLDIENRWDVTHRKTGLKFPCQFTTQQKAKAFLKKVQLVMSFEGIECAIIDGGTKTEWTKGAPTKNQKAKIKALMEKYGE